MNVARQINKLLRHKLVYLKPLAVGNGYHHCAATIGMINYDNNNNNNTSTMNYYQQYRNCSNLPTRRSLPPLMEYPEVIWPSFLKSVKNWILINFIVSRFFDPDFYIKDFIEGARQAITVISSRLAKGDFASLNELVTSDALLQLKSVTEKLPLGQKQSLQVPSEDIFLIFPYEVGIMFDDDVPVEKQKRWLEITVICHVFRGFTEMQKKEIRLDWSAEALQQYRNDLYVCNYRFIKEYTKGVDSNWMVNIVNHFRPAEIIEE